jgi:hypothetical protein
VETMYYSRNSQAEIQQMKGLLLAGYETTSGE